MAVRKLLWREMVWRELLSEIWYIDWVIDHFNKLDEAKYPRKNIQTSLDPTLDGGGWASKVKHFN